MIVLLRFLWVVGTSGLEPPTSRLSGARSNHLSYAPLWLTVFSSLSPLEALLPGGDDGNRTHDPLLAGQVLSQLSYTPIFFNGYSVSFRSLKIEQRFKNSLQSVLGPLVFSLSLLEYGKSVKIYHVLHRKEVIQPHLPIRLPCYDLTPITSPTFDHVPLAVRLWASGVANFHGLTGGVYKARERIHRGMLIRDY